VTHNAHMENPNRKGAGGKQDISRPVSAPAPVALAVVSVALFVSTSAIGADVIPIELDLASAHQLSIRRLPKDGYELVTRGGDPYIMSLPLKRAYDPDRQHVLAFDYFCEKGISDLELFYGPPIRAGQSASGPAILSSEAWTGYSMDIRAHQQGRSWRGGYKVLRLDFGRHAGRTIRVRNIVLRPPNEEEIREALEGEDRRAAAAAFDAMLQESLKTEYEDRIAKVKVTADNVVVSLDLRGTGDLHLCEVPLHQTPVGRREFVWSRPAGDRRGRVTMRLERTRAGHDRVFSSWILMKKTAAGMAPASRQRFAEDIPSKWSLRRDRPLNKKGCTGLHGGNVFQYNDYKALGIRNATKNILLPSLIADKPGGDTFPHEFNGITVHVRKNALERLDRAMIEMDRLKIVVSAIILIPRNTPMSHPDCAAKGIYAMANVVEEKGWTVYAAALDVLARRYLRPDRRYGRITHWIMHNEVDAGWIWTNAGEKPVHTYLDLYYRSMRTAHGVIRRHGDAGDVLISLTHYWTRRHNSKCYPPKDMIDILARRTSVEGDFSWGLAYHPYPQDLRDPRTWLDRDATLDFETKLVTPKNLEVLDAYMRRDEMLYRDSVRTIVLFEQGSNSPRHDEKSYRDQAAGLVYTWLKVEALDSLESYVHHRWMDHPKEGGLNLGLRRRASGPDPDEGRKPAWEVYRKLTTPEQAEAVRWARTVIPAEYLRDIPAKVDTSE